MLNKYLVTFKQIQSYGLSAILQGGGELEPEGKGSSEFPKEHLLARSEMSEIHLCYHLRLTIDACLGNISSLSHIKYNIDLKALIFLYNLILDCPTSEKVYS